MNSDHECPKKDNKKDLFQKSVSKIINTQTTPGGGLMQHREFSHGLTFKMKQRLIFTPTKQNNAKIDSKKSQNNENKENLDKKNQNNETQDKISANEEILNKNGQKNENNDKNKQNSLEKNDKNNLQNDQNCQNNQNEIIDQNLQNSKINQNNQKLENNPNSKKLPNHLTDKTRLNNFRLNNFCLTQLKNSSQSFPPIEKSSLIGKSSLLQNQKSTIIENSSRNEKSSFFENQPKKSSELIQSAKSLNVLKKSMNTKAKSEWDRKLQFPVAQDFNMKDVEGVLNLANAHIDGNVLNVSNYENAIENLSKYKKSKDNHLTSLKNFFNEDLKISQKKAEAFTKSLNSSFSVPKKRIRTYITLKTLKERISLCETICRHCEKSKSLLAEFAFTENNAIKKIQKLNNFNDDFIINFKKNFKLKYGADLRQNLKNGDLKKIEKSEKNLKENIYLNGIVTKIKERQKEQFQKLWIEHNEKRNNLLKSQKKLYVKAPKLIKKIEEENHRKKMRLEKFIYGLKSPSTPECQKKAFSIENDQIKKKILPIFVEKINENNEKIDKKDKIDEKFDKINKKDKNEKIFDKDKLEEENEEKNGKT